MNDLLILLRNDCRMVFNLRFAAKEQSIFKGIVIGVFAAAILAGLFFLFLDAFRFLSSLGGIGVLLIQHLFSLFFLGLGIMLVLSNIITAYAVFFRAVDVPFLLLQPVSRGAVAVHKYLESALLSSWAFFFIMVPFVSAFACHQKLPLIFAFWTALFSLPFVALCSGIGVILIVLAVRFLPRLRGWIWFLAFFLCLLAFGFHDVFKNAGYKSDDVSFLLASLVPGIKLASFPLWPSWWVSEGIMALVRERWDRGALLFCVLMANLLFMAMLVEFIGSRLFYGAWERVASAGARSPGLRRAGYTGPFSFLAGFLPPEYRAIILKDIRAFFRDPVQMIQGLLFFGLLGIYFFNLRNLHYHLLAPVWRNLIAFLNLFSLATIMCSFCSRFVFPQISLEGHSFWIIGLSPTGMGRVLKIKYILAVFMMLIISGTLMTVSALMLSVPPYVLLITIMVAVAVSFALCGLALGLGAIFMDREQTNPVAIISGFGGTFNLVLSLAYIMAAIIPFGFICHERLLGGISNALFAAGIAAASIWLVIITVLTALLPLIAGRRSLLSREY